jgi:carbon storage regulator
MLVLSRRVPEELVLFDKDNLQAKPVRLTVVRIKGGLVRIGVDAPDNIRIVRGEIADAIRKELEIEAAIENPTEIQENASNVTDAHPNA